MLRGIKSEALKMTGMFTHASFLKTILVILLLLLTLPAMAQMSDAALKTQVETEYPIIKYATDDWVRIQALREFSYKHTAAPMQATNPAGGTDQAYSLGLNNVSSVLTGSKTLGDGYSFFDNRGGGVLCGQYAEMLEKLYQLYGYHAIELDLGFSPPTPSGSTFGHAQTLAQITRDGKTFFTINDPTPNLSYAWADGRSPIDYRDMIWLLSQNKSKYISYVDVSSPIDAKFSVTNGTDFNVYPYSPNNVPSGVTQLFFSPDGNYNVSGRIDFPTAISSIDLDVTYFNGGTVTMTAFDPNSEQIGQVTATDQSGHNHLSYSANAIKYVLLTGNNHNAAINISNLQVKIINPMITFSNAQGFASTDPSATNRVAAKMDATFSDAAGLSLYPAPPSSTQLYFNPDPSNSGYVTGRIDFPKAVSSVDLDVIYFAGGSVTMYVYDAAGNLLGQPIGTDQAGNNHVSFTANVSAGNLIQHVILFGRQSVGGGNYAAINFTNLQTKIISPVIKFSHDQGFINNSFVDQAHPDQTQNENDHQHYINGVMDGGRYNPPFNNIGYFSDEPDPRSGLITFGVDLYNVNYSFYPLITFSNAQGFTASDPTSTNNTAAQWNARFSTTNGAGFSIYPAPPNSSMLYFNPDANGNVAGRIDFPTPVPSTSLDVTYFAGGTVTMTAFDSSGNSLGQVQGTGHLSLRPNTFANSISYATLTGNQGGAAINISNVESFPQALSLPAYPQWAVKSPRTIARFEALGDYPGAWKDQLKKEGRPGETIYLHTFPEGIPSSRPDTGTFQPAVNLAKQIINDFRVIKFTYAEGFTSSDPTDTNTVAAKMNVQFSVTDGANGGYFGVYPYPPNNVPPSGTQMGFAADSAGYVGGRIDFPTPATAVDLDITYFNGATAVMYAYDANGNLLKQVQGTDQTGRNHLGITATGTKISYVILCGVANSGAGLNVTNLQIRTLGPTIRFNVDEGFTSNSVINSVAANMNAQFSVTNSGGYGLYLPSSSAPNVQQLLFNPDSSGNVSGKISFPTAVSAVDLDVVYFNAGTVTMTAYDASNNQIGQVQGSDQVGSTLDHLNHLSIAGNPGNLAPISYVLLTGKQAYQSGGYAAINIKNVQTFNWQ